LRGLQFTEQLRSLCSCVAWTDPGRDPRFAVVDLTRDLIALCTLGDYQAFEYVYISQHHLWIYTKFNLL